MVGPEQNAPGRWVTGGRLSPTSIRDARFLVDRDAVGRWTVVELREASTIGRRNSRAGEPHPAERDCRSAVRVDADAADELFRLGAACPVQGRLDEAAVCYRQAVELEPTSHEARHSLGIALECQGRLDEAAASYEQALQLKPDGPEAHNNLG